MAIVGGRLQGLEALYLARLAGIETALFDRDSKAPARALADNFFNVEIGAAKDGIVKDVLKECDLVIPATENDTTLSHLVRLGSELQIPVAFHEKAYELSSSKLESNRLFKQLGVPIPTRWPDCGFPVVVKPSGASGSNGVLRIDNNMELAKQVSRVKGDIVVQQVLEGPSYSLEVIGTGAKYSTLQITKLEFDHGYDCKRVWAGPAVGASIRESFKHISEYICDAIHLKGIMDIEVIDASGVLRVLEIDARLPSQTPSTVFHSSGLNMIDLLAHSWCSEKLSLTPEELAPKRTVLYEHFQLLNGVLSVIGEHALRDAQGLKLYHDIFGAETLISNFEFIPEAWVATAIFVGESERDVWRSHEKAVEQIRDVFNVEQFQDTRPPQ
jgi:3-methylornithine--L-lysine ligase